MHEVLEERSAGSTARSPQRRSRRRRASSTRSLAEQPSQLAPGRSEGVRAAALRTVEADLRRYLAHEAADGCGWNPEGIELRFGFEEQDGSLPGLTLGDGPERVTLRGVIDRVDVEPGGSRRAIVRDYKSGSARPAHRGRAGAADRQLQVALYMLAVRELLGLEPVAGFYQPLGGGDLRAARRLSRGDVRSAPGWSATDARSREQLDDELEEAVAVALALAARLRAGELTPAPRTCSRDGCLFPGSAGSGVSPVAGEPAAARAFTTEQLAAIERRDGELLLDAGAGSGKTSVLVERFARAVHEDGFAVTQILAITFTEKAAAELRERIRGRLRELGADEAARATEGAWISTIHGFCARLLRTHALAAGLDPAFTVLDDSEAQPLVEAAFDEALDALARDEPGGVELIAAYGAGALRGAIVATYAELRSRGAREPAAAGAGGGAATSKRRGPSSTRAAECALAELGAIAEPSVRVVQALARLERVGVAARAGAIPGRASSTRSRCRGATAPL